MPLKIGLTIIIFIFLISIVFAGRSFLSNLFSKDQEDTILKIPESNNGFKVLFLHHSTGRNIWDGGVRDWFDTYNNENGTDIEVVEQDFPKKDPYGWKNYPYDYWNIWIKHAGNSSFKKEPTLELITKEYDMVIWKHCFPVGRIEADTGNANVDSDIKSLENYKLQYTALKEKMKSFPQTKFIVWTIPALVESKTTESYAQRARDFYNWVINEWNEIDDNIFLWDFYTLETEGGLYLREEYAINPSNSHPNESFSKMVSPYFCQRIVDVINGRGDTSNITGK